MVHRQRRRASLALGLLLVVCAGILSGCWDRKAVEDIGFVTVLGIDKAADSAVTIIVQIANPRVISGGKGDGGGGGQVPAVVHRITQPTVSAALRNLETFNNRRISLVQTRVIIFGRALMEEGTHKHLGVLTRFREFRRNIQVMMADGTAEEILTTRPALERDPAVFLADLSRRANERTARAPQTMLHDFMVAYETLGEAMTLPIISPFTVEPGLEEQPGHQSRLARTALFRGPKLVGELNEEETETFMVIKGKVKALLETVPPPGTPGDKSTFRLTPGSRSVELDTSGKEVSFKIDIELEAEGLETESEDPQLGDPVGLHELEDAMSRRLNSEAARLIRKLQTECGCDALGLGHYLRSRFIDWPSWVKYNWPDRFPKAKIDVSLRVIIRRVGMTFQSPKSR